MTRPRPTATSTSTPSTSTGGTTAGAATESTSAETTVPPRLPAAVRSTAGSAVSPTLVLVGILLVAANLRAGITTVGPLVGQVQADAGLSSALASGLISLPLLAFAAVSPFVPRLARQLGLERTLALGLAVLAVGLVVRSLPGSVTLWVGTGLVGMSIAVLNVALPALVKRDFAERVGPVTGMYSAVQSIFAALAAGVAVPLAGLTVLGWRLPLGMWAGLAVIAIGVLAPQLGRRTVVAPADDDIRIDAHPALAPERSPWRSALGWQVTLFMGLQSLGFYVLITWLPSIETAAGTDVKAAGLHQLLLNGSGIAGSLLCSAAMTRLRDQRVLATTAPTVFGVAVLGIVLVPGLGALWAVLAGLACGANIVLALSFLSLRSSSHTQAASLSGMAQSVGYLLAAAGPVAVGALHDATGSWTLPLVGLLGSTLVLVVFGALAGRRRVLP